MEPESANFDVIHDLEEVKMIETAGEPIAVQQYGTTTQQLLPLLGMVKM